MTSPPGLTSDQTSGNCPAWGRHLEQSRGGHQDTLTTQYCDQHPPPSSHLSLMMASEDGVGGDTDLGDVLVYSLSRCDQPRRRTLNDCVLSLAGVSSRPVTSLGSARSPGQVGGKPRPITAQSSGHVICPDQSEDSIKSWRVTIAERAESGERHCIYKTVNSFRPCISHITYIQQ